MYGSVGLSHRSVQHRPQQQRPKWWVGMDVGLGDSELVVKKNKNLQITVRHVCVTHSVV